MTLAETYAGASAVPLAKPDIVDTFYPLDFPLDKAVLIHAFAGATVQQGNQLVAAFPAKLYSHFDEVLDLLRVPLTAAGYRLYQIGGPGEPQLPGIESLVGKTTMHQCAHLVKGCALLIGNDSMWAHVRGAAGGAQVHIYGSTSKPHFPHWRDPAKAILIESHRQGKRPTYAAQENPKSIDFIPPEQIANAAFELLGPSMAQMRNVITSDISQYAPVRVTRQSLYIGDAYHQHIVELIPDCVVDPRVQIRSQLVIRMDLAPQDGLKEAGDRLIANLQLRPAAIITDHELNLNLLAQLKPRIQGLRIEVGKVSADWIKAVKRLGIQTAFFSNEADPEKLAQLRLDLYDACLFDQYVAPKREDFLKGVRTYLNQEAIDIESSIDTMRFKTNRVLLSNGKVYLSEAHWRGGRPTATPDQREDSVIDDPVFWESAPHIYAFTQ